MTQETGGREADQEIEESLGIGFGAGDQHYRAYVGIPENYDIIAGMTFSLLVALGLRQHHHLLDIGCGSLRIGRLLIPYLNCGGYSGIEPNGWLIDEGIQHEIGRDLVSIKRPNLYVDDSARILPADAVYDFALAQSIFTHAGLDLVKSWLGGITSHLRDTGVLAASFIAGETDYVESDWVYPDCVPHRADTLERLGKEAGLRFIPLDWVHPTATWALFVKPGFRTDWFEAQGLSWNAWARFHVASSS